MVSEVQVGLRVDSDSSKASDKKSLVGKQFWYVLDFTHSTLVKILADLPGLPRTLTLVDELGKTGWRGGRMNVPLSCFRDWFCLATGDVERAWEMLKEREPITDVFQYVSPYCLNCEHCSMKQVNFDMKRGRISFNFVCYGGDEPSYEHFTKDLKYGPRLPFEPALHFTTPYEKPGLKQSRKVTAGERKVDPKVLEFMASEDVEGLRAYLGEKK